MEKNNQPPRLETELRKMMQVHEEMYTVEDIDGRRQIRFRTVIKPTWTRVPKDQPNWDFLAGSDLSMDYGMPSSEKLSKPLSMKNNNLEDLYNDLKDEGRRRMRNEEALRLRRIVLLTIYFILLGLAMFFFIHSSKLIVVVCLILAAVAFKIIADEKI